MKDKIEVILEVFFVEEVVTKNTDGFALIISFENDVLLLDKFRDIVKLDGLRAHQSGGNKQS